MAPLVLSGQETFQSLKPCDLSCCTKSEIKAYFENSYDLNESIFTGLKEECAIYKCPDRLRLPLIFYYAHTACVYVNKMFLGGLITKRINPEYESLFETGVDEMSWDDTENFRMGGQYKWPNLKDVVEYRRQVREVILQVIENTPLELPITKESPWWSLFMGMEHERIHHETSSVLIRQLPVDMVTRPKGWKYGPVTWGEGVKENPMVTVSEQTTVTLGKPQDFPSYGWDNEYGELECKVPPFRANKYIITNREYMEFVESGGYQDSQFWSKEGWSWKQYRQANHPLYWVCSQGCKNGCGSNLSASSHCRPQDMEGTNEKFRLRAVYDVIDMPWDWPAEVNYHEAKAYAKWKGPSYRLPTEAEYHVMRGEQKDVKEGVACDIVYQDNCNANIRFIYGSSTPVNMFPATSAGFHDVFGNVWQWTEDHFNGFPGQDTHWLYDDFSTPCFDGRHNMIMGGSWITTGDSASRFARFSFRRHFFQHAGFRLVESIGPQPTPLRLVDTEVFVMGVGIEDKVDPKEVNLPNGFTWVPSTNLQYHYDTAESLNRQLQLEYGAGSKFLDQLLEHVTRTVKQHGTETRRILHIGCGVGKISFQLAKQFEEVVAVDFCGRFLDAAISLQSGKSLTYTVVNSDNKREKHEAVLGDTSASNVIFKQLTWLPNEIGTYDVVLFENIDRVMNPKAWLRRLWEILNKKGVLIIISTKGWDQAKLRPYIQDRLQCSETHSLPYYELGGNKKQVNYTVWHLKSSGYFHG
ncbi:uncharacterized protein LOC106178593 isoform X2 [Lingula anatina]|nr:uncharacterized protein LOC106178593 isoform X2 [Lingula anatina]XP_013417317.1 uncharacterized protein LOC106178593 isoform X2 [Lingula anatina]XP_013417326.1 uncharacterized protein LOC106178593 isoform X2 [Lingula anatina]XP_013417333.1 uncharacterized protein LOC106178593 isoform X2 [Lingula anatina]|eukprot:XP_013417309.1 uncharacterized protein LOC106178593 isoform X2 [Lingula anatina]